MLLEFKRSTEINGLQIPIEIVITVEKDDMEFNGDDPIDITNHKSGDLFMAIITVRADAFGLNGHDSLGGVSLQQHNTNREEVLDIINDYGMINNAILDLTQQVQDKADLLKPFVRIKDSLWIS